jgi:hypothetical protein
VEAQRAGEGGAAFEVFTARIGEADLGERRLLVGRPLRDLEVVLPQVAVAQVDPGLDRRGSTRSSPVSWIGFAPPSVSVPESDVVRASKAPPGRSGTVTRMSPCATWKTGLCAASAQRAPTDIDTTDTHKNVPAIFPIPDPLDMRPIPARAPGATAP